MDYEILKACRRQLQNFLPSSFSESYTMKYTNKQIMGIIVRICMRFQLNLSFYTFKFHHKLKNLLVIKNELRRAIIEYKNKFQIHIKT